jgi:4-hydroxy-2-oxoheptanedioate aldolase
MSIQQKHSLRQDLARGPLIGTFAAIPHPVALEITAAAGFDFVIIDAEHAQIDRAGIENLVRAADVVGTGAIVRVPGLTSEWVSSALDAGAGGVLVPRVSTAAQARAAVAAMRYPPIGERGAGPGRASSYGVGLRQYLQTANDNLLLAIQVESAEAVANIDAIAQVPGVDVLFIGPGDLGVSLSVQPPGAPTLEEAIARVIAVCAGHGRTVGIFMPEAAHAQQWLSRGVKFLTIAADSMYLQAAAQAAATLCRSAVASR